MSTWPDCTRRIIVSPTLAIIAIKGQSSQVPSLDFIVVSRSAFGKTLSIALIIESGSVPHCSRFVVFGMKNIPVESTLKVGPFVQPFE